MMRPVTTTQKAGKYSQYGEKCCKNLVLNDPDKYKTLTKRKRPINTQSVILRAIARKMVAYQK
jgi:hypothetical protein